MLTFLKNFKKILRFFDQNLYGKLTFFTIFSKYFLDFCIHSESIYLWKIRADFYNNSSDLRGNVPTLPPPRATCFGLFSPGQTEKFDTFVNYQRRLSCRWHTLPLIASFFCQCFDTKSYQKYNTILTMISTKQKIQKFEHFSSLGKGF